LSFFRFSLFRIVVLQISLFIIFLF
jgi:hypothetical protein